jgi:hypothetical protein
LNIIISLPQGGEKRERERERERERQTDNHLLESAHSQFSATTEVSFTRSTWSKVYKNQIHDLHEDPKKG